MQPSACLPPLAYLKRYRQPRGYTFRVVDSIQLEPFGGGSFDADRPGSTLV